MTPLEVPNFFYSFSEFTEVPLDKHKIFQVMSFIHEKIRREKIKYIRRKMLLRLGESSQTKEDTKRSSFILKNSLGMLDAAFKTFLFLFSEVKQTHLSRPICDWKCRATRRINGQYYKVVIIGAGIAGLATSYKLSQSGFRDFKILEAQTQAGGRVKSFKFADGFIELGAQWLHGSKNSFYEFANSQGLLSSNFSNEGQGYYLRMGGALVSSALVSEVANVIESILSECETFYYKIPKSAVTFSVGEFLRNKFENYLRSCRLDTPYLIKIKRELFDWHLRFQIIDNSCRSLDDLSAFTWGRYENCGTENINVKYNYSHIVGTILNYLPENSVLYNCAVNSIEWGKIIKITTSSHKQIDKIIYCDHVIVTCSAGYLNAHLDTLFIPKLPDPYRKAFKSIGFGTINKIFLLYEENWWDDAEGLQLVWDTSLDNLEIDIEKEMEWTRGITGFDVVSGLSKVLVCWVGGIGAELMELIPDDLIAIHCTKLLTEFIGTNIPLPLKIARSEWNRNEYICGSYSYHRLNCQEKEEKLLDDLLLPIYNKKRREKVPRILFAGEALHNRHHSTVHGAFATGIAQASKLLDFFKSS